MKDHIRPWSSLTSEEHEFHFNPQNAVPNFAEFRLLREPANERAAATLKQERDVPYGEHPLRRLDIYPSGEGGKTPVHVFFHGGYWRAQDKAGFAFIAGMLVEHGITAVVPNYELCPDSTLDGVADSALASLEWVYRNIERYGGDPRSIGLSGHSAGAHLVAEIIATDWRARGIEPGFIQDAVMVDPTPAMLTSVNEQLRLSPEISARHNVEIRAPQVDCPARLFVGGMEPWHWIDQTFRYSHHLRPHGRDPEVHVLPGFNHFSILRQFMEPASSIGSGLVANAPRPKQPAIGRRA